MMTGCASYKIPSPKVSVSDQCKVVAKDLPAAPDSSELISPEKYEKFTDSQISNGVTGPELVSVIEKNNEISQTNLNNLVSLQIYIKTLQQNGVISK